MDLPCGRCEGCRITKKREWGIRCFHEAQTHRHNAFITLTYDDEHNPGQISKLELQRFFKRLRKHGKFRYFACGEYGDLTHRPHYHALIFGQDFRFNESRTTQRGDYTSPVIADCWDKGLHECADVSGSAAFYVAGYEQKKINDPDTFTLMSRNIGKEYAEKYQGDLRRAQSVVIEGKEHPIPKKYADWIDIQEYLDKQADYIRTTPPWEHRQNRHHHKQRIKSDRIRELANHNL